MKKIVALFSLLAALTASAADLQVKDLLVSMPDSIMTLISPSGRQDLIDFYESGGMGWTRNRLNGESHTLYFGEDRLSIATSYAGTLDMFVLPFKKGDCVVCVIKSVKIDDYRDSRISFYTPSWQRISTESLIELPAFDDFLDKKALKNDSVSDLRAMSLIRFVSVTPSADDNGVLEFSYTSLDNIGPDADRFRHFFRPEPLRYVWNGRRFKKMR